MNLKNILLFFGIPAAVIGFIFWLIQQLITAKADNHSLKAQIDSLKEEKTELKQRIREIEQENSGFKAQTPKKALQFDTKFHYYKDEASQLYCPSCYDDKDKLIHLKPCADPNYGWQCPTCKNVVKNPNYNPPIQESPHRKWHIFD